VVAEVIPFGLPIVIAALKGEASIDEMAFSLGMPVLEHSQVAEFCNKAKTPTSPLIAGSSSGSRRKGQ
jgi:hypothetical protein